MAVNVIVSHISKLLLDNERMKAFEFDLKPNEQTDMHEHPYGYIVYPLSSGLLRFTTKNGQSQDVQIRTGDFDVRPPVVHSVENIGKTEVRMLAIELKK